jgi:quercetin dioxygenase-like cupin family protein
MDVRSRADREGRPDHHGTATSWYLVDRDELKAETDGTHLEYVTEFEIRGGGVLEPHYHNNFEWFYVLEGEGTMIIEGEEREVGPGALIAIGPNAVHSLRPRGDAGIHCLCWGLNLSKDGSRYDEPAKP